MGHTGNRLCEKHGAGCSDDICVARSRRADRVYLDGDLLSGTIKTRNAMTRIFVIVLTILLTPITSWALVDLYVDTDLGSNANACTSPGASACATMCGAIGKIPASISTAYVVHCKGA